MPKEIIENKSKELEELKFQAREKEIAQRRFQKYRTIKFHGILLFVMIFWIERKKWDRRRKRAEKAILEINKKIIPEGMSIDEFEEQKSREINV